MSRLGPLARREFRLLFLARGISFAAVVTAAVVALLATRDIRQLRWLDVGENGADARD